MLSPALTPTIVDPASVSSVACAAETLTYGGLIGRVTTAVAAARLASTGPFANPAVAHGELLGYERFLRVAGAHLHVLAVLGRCSAGPLGNLANYLATLDEGDVGVAPGGRWYQAATLLGAAHDVVATHLQVAPDGGLLPRTPQAEEQLEPRAAEHAGRQVAGLVLTATSTRPQLVAAALRSQHQLPRQQRPITTAHANHLAKKVSTAEVYAMAALWGHDRATGVRDASSQGATTLDGLEPAALVGQVSRSAAFRHALDALKVLRQVSYRQTHGISAASPASLRDLALLGIHFAKASSLPEPRTPLERVQRAHAADTLEAARQAWTAASRDLTVLRGLTKAPAAYGTAAHQLLQADPSDPTLRAAMLAALPRLGRDAAANITELGRTSALLGMQRDLSLRRSWQPLPNEAVSELAGRFRTASRATALARHVEQQLARQQAPSIAEGAPVPARSRQLVRGAQR